MQNVRLACISLNMNSFYCLTKVAMTAPSEAYVWFNCYLFKLKGLLCATGTDYSWFLVTSYNLCTWNNALTRVHTWFTEGTNSYRTTNLSYGPQADKHQNCLYKLNVCITTGLHSCKRAMHFGKLHRESFNLYYDLTFVLAEIYDIKYGIVAHLRIVTKSCFLKL